VKISFNNYFGRTFSAGGFTMKPRDAFDTAKNIKIVFVQRTGWFQSPKPMAVAELAAAYKALCPDMEIMHPGVVDQMLQPAMIRRLGFAVDEDSNVSYIP
jgi:hypothetical protein